ncbi:MAG: cytochrome b/b6 domain-containing protein [Thermodesulfobacteriota bacterium]
MQIKRFNVIDRVFHLFLMFAFSTMSATGFGRLFINTDFGKSLCGMLGGYDVCGSIHRWVGILMVVGFALHILYAVTRMPWGNLKEGLLGPDSLVPNLTDLRHVGQQILWGFGKGPRPELEKWTYWEKFDYWAVFWGLPLLAVTGFMMMYPLETCRVVPGWCLNLASLLHKAEAILAVSFIFVVHFFVQHLRPGAFPLNESIFSGTVPRERAMEEKPAWVTRLRDQTCDEQRSADPPGLLFRTAYFLLGYSVMAFCLYMLVNGILYGGRVSLH